MADQSIYIGISDLKSVELHVSDIYVYNGYPNPPALYYRRRGQRTGSRFFYIVSGETTFQMATGGQLTARRGDVVYLHGDVEYDSWWSTDFPAEYIIVNCHMATPAKDEICLGENLLVLFRDRGLDVLPIFRNMNRLYCKDSVSEVLQIKALFYEFLSTTIHVLEKEITATTLDEHAFQVALRYIRENFNKEFKMKEVAELCNVSEATLRRLFRKFCGTSPGHYRQSLRMNHANRLLETGMYTVSEVSAITGFSDVSYFTKSYFKAFGWNPSQSIPK